jgi:hypothetical protein
MFFIIKSEVSNVCKIVVYKFDRSILSKSFNLRILGENHLNVM